METLSVVGIILGVAGLLYLIWNHGYQAGRQDMIDSIDIFTARYQAKLDTRVEEKGEGK